MREMLFRGQSIHNETCYEGSLIKYPVGNKTEIFYGDTKSNAMVFSEVKPETVSQYTGHKDKFGNKIFEGDIVRWDDGSKGIKWRVAVVELFPALQFRIIKIECDFVQSCKEGHVFEFGSFIYSDTHNHLEIIGNIHSK